MPEEPETPEKVTSSAESGESGRYLFPPLFLGGALEELEALADRKKRIYDNLGEKDSSVKLSNALELARDRLQSVLKTPRTKIGS